jgi:uncharacterized Ntn-hydrolase superfamily protein
MTWPYMAPSNLVCTYSIVARDPQTGRLGVAVQSHWFSVGGLVGWAEAGVGAVATQSMVRVDYGPLGLQRMGAGLSAPQALAQLLAQDDGRDLRQVAMVDSSGCVAVHTGERCIAEAGHEVGSEFSVQANMMANSQIWTAMGAAYRQAKGDLADRMLQALEAAQAAGGDVRGRQSAAMLIVAADRHAEPWKGVALELRVEDHPDPLTELRRLVGLQRAYEHMNRGDELLGTGETEHALQEYRLAAHLAPEVPELPFWHAVTLADLDRLQEALPLFREVFARDPKLVVLLRRLPAAGLLRDDPQMLDRILAVAAP